MYAAFTAASLAYAIATTAPVFAQTEPTIRTVDIAHSKANFGVTHLYVEHVDGNVPIVAGSVWFAAESNVPQRVQATLDPRRISTGDADRDDDLQGQDWFDTKHFPRWTFVATTIAATSNGFTMTGSLEILGRPQPVTLTVIKRGQSYRATGSLDRHAIGMQRTSIDGLIGNDIAIVLDIALQ